MATRKTTKEKPAPTTQVENGKLKRQTLSKSVRKDLAELAVKASALLGYNQLAAYASTGTLARTLAELDMKPFTPASVVAYKKKQIAKARKEHNPTQTFGFSISWKMIPLAKYDKPIPEFAIRKAVQVKEKCPTAEFFVDELSITRHQRRIANGDPFLVARVGKGERYWLEVWNEPEFEASLIDGEEQQDI